VFLVIIGYSQDQIAPVIGLLDTIIGYLLGVGSRNLPEAPTPVVLPPIKQPSTGSRQNPFPSHHSRSFI
jgi:hypothetical protein